MLLRHIENNCLRVLALHKNQMPRAVACITIKANSTQFCKTEWKCHSTTQSKQNYNALSHLTWYVKTVYHVLLQHENNTIATRCCVTWKATTTHACGVALHWKQLLHILVSHTKSNCYALLLLHHKANATVQALATRCCVALQANATRCWVISKAITTHMLVHCKNRRLLRGVTYQWKHMHARIVATHRKCDGAMWSKQLQRAVALRWKQMRRDVATLIAYATVPYNQSTCHTRRCITLKDNAARCYIALH